MSVAIPSPLAVAVRDRRREMGLSQQALARRADVAVDTIRKLEQGRISDPRYTTASAISRALQMGEAFTVPA